MYFLFLPNEKDVCCHCNSDIIPLFIEFTIVYAFIVFYR